MALSYFSIECFNENFNYASDFDDCKLLNGCSLYFSMKVFFWLIVNNNVMVIVRLNKLNTLLLPLL